MFYQVSPQGSPCAPQAEPLGIEVGELWEMENDKRNMIEIFSCYNYCWRRCL